MTQQMCNGLLSVQHNSTHGNGICEREHNKPKQIQMHIF